ncbi:hypothetical protein [Sphaerisporangium corydalis]|uniref:Serine/threonine protein kinase n=1 Tax=Sphaerisporangium corydalis TaxID=1441875 RepID=A0ABV9EM63_9ACTN|nr:hypothetical protein [Sphaerisporangium corydalis]
MDDDDDEPTRRRLGYDRRGPIVVGLALLVAAGAGLWFAWPSPSDEGSDVPAAIQSPTGPRSKASPSGLSAGVESPPPPPATEPAPKRTKRTTPPIARRTALPPPPSSSKAPSPKASVKPSKSARPQTGPTAPPPPPSSSKPTSAPSTKPPASDDTQTGPTLPPPPPGG